MADVARAAGAPEKLWICSPDFDEAKSAEMSAAGALLLEIDAEAVQIGVERGGVVTHAGAVGRADLDQPASRLGHDLGHPEAAADLDQLAPGHDDPAAPGQRREHQQHRGGTVVHHEGGLGPARPGQQVKQHPIDQLLGPDIGRSDAVQWRQGAE